MPGFGLGLAGLGEAAPFIAQQQEKAREIAQQRMNAANLYQMMTASGGAGIYPVTPQAPMPAAGPPPNPSASAPVTPGVGPKFGPVNLTSPAGIKSMAQSPAPPAQPPRQAAAPGGTGGFPTIDQLMGKLSSMDIPDWQKGQALETYLSQVAPVMRANAEADFRKREAEHWDAMDYWRGKQTNYNINKPYPNPRSAALANDRQYQKLYKDMMVAENRYKIDSSQKNSDALDAAKQKLDDYLDNTSATPSAGGAAPSPTGGATPEKRVNVIAPDGSKGDIPASQLQDALKNGYKQAQ